jgi:Spy/CpxP family protein refolding chaperone
MKKTVITLLALLFVLTISAQGPFKFSPEKFKEELEQFIVKEANMTPQEAAKFLPMFGEMHEKQRAIYERQRELRQTQLTDEAAYKNAIKKADQMDLELKTIQQTYHNKFLSVLPASKVFKVINAENRFHREMWKKWGGGQRRHR